MLSIVRSHGEPERLRAQAAISLVPVLEMAGWGEFDDPDEVPITEDTFHKIQEFLRTRYAHANLPKEVRRRIRCPQAWHPDAIRTAYASGDEEWRLTAVFAMRWVRGFDEQTLQLLDSANPEIHYEAVCAAGNGALDAAWPHVVALAGSEETEKSLRLAAIDAAASILPRERRGRRFSALKMHAPSHRPFKRGHFYVAAKGTFLFGVDMKMKSA